MYSEIAGNKRKTVLIMLGFIALVGGLAWVVGQYVGNPSIALAVLVGAIVYAGIMYYSGSKLSLAVNGAKEMAKSDDVRLWRIVENLAITDGLPMPKVYLMEDSSPNAFATGRDPQHAAVAVTTGLLVIMEDNELEGVIAHELGHIKNYDIRVSMIAFALSAIVSILADVILRLTWFRGDNDRNSNNQIVLIVGVVAAIIAPVVATLIQLAISRKREYLADATGALTTRYPEGLANALSKIAENGSTLKRQNTATAHLFFANPLRSGGLTSLFSTHPPIEERIKRLNEMASHA